MNEMKPASEAVVTAAIDLILKDIAFQNRDDSPAHLWSISDTDTEVSALSRQFKLLSEALRSVEAQIQSRISEVRRLGNSPSFIQRLPVEILLEIFRSVVNEWHPPYGYYKALGRLSGVCPRWAAAIDQAPSLWSVVFNNLDPRMVDKIIDKSGDHPLSLWSWKWVDMRFEEYTYRTSEAFLKRLLPTVSRWEAAQLTMSGKDMRCLGAYLGDLSAPKLRKLHVEDEYGRGSPVNLLRGGTEHLEELELSGVSVCWTSPLLSRLRILRLKHLNYPTDDVTTSRLLTILMQCPDLSELRIHRCDFYASTPDELPPRFELPRLEVLDLDDIHPSTTAYSILSQISPSSKYKQFRLGSEFEGAPPPSHVISHHIPSLRHLMATATIDQVLMQFDFQTCRYIVQLMGHSPSLDVRIKYSSPMVTLAWITEAFAGMFEGVATEAQIGHVLSDGDDITVLSDEDDTTEAQAEFVLSGEDIATICSHISTITTLHLSGNVAPFVHHLSTPTRIDGKQ
ncbi:hypothetical protein FRB99_005227, partial [Tulasnella sp. 403]